MKIVAFLLTVLTAINKLKEGLVVVVTISFWVIVFFSGGFFLFISSGIILLFEKIFNKNKILMPSKH